MKKFIKIYNSDTTADTPQPRHVLINASDVKFVNQFNEGSTSIHFNVEAGGLDNVYIYHQATTDHLMQNAIIDAIKKISVKAYTNSTIEVDLPYTVTRIAQG